MAHWEPPKWFPAKSDVRAASAQPGHFVYGRRTPVWSPADLVESALRGRIQDGAKVDLTRMEYTILEYLALHTGAS
eukprot:1185318-Prorocentrum_minimum.AAC.9